MYQRGDSNHWIAVLLMACSLLFMVGCGDDEDDEEDAEVAIILGMRILW